MDKQRNFKLISYICLLGLLLAYGCGGSQPQEAEEQHTRIEKKHNAAANSASKKSASEKGTRIGGEIKENTVLSASGSPYFVTRNLVILPDVKVEIEPGVEIKIAPYTGIVVKGNLHAIGAENNKIVFTCSDKDDSWDSLTFADESFDYQSEELIEGHGCIVENCKFEKAKTAIICEKSSPVLRNNIFEKNEEGVKFRDRSNGVFAYNMVTDNTIGITCEESSSPDIKHNTIIGVEGKGIICRVSSSPNITYNTIFGQGETWWRGIMIQANSSPKIHYNNIYANGGFNVCLLKTTPGEASPQVDAKDNWWGVEDKETIAKMIQDKNDKSDLGEVIFVPFSNIKVPNASHKG